LLISPRFARKDCGLTAGCQCKETVLDSHPATVAAPEAGLAATIRCGIRGGQGILADLVDKQ